MKAWLVKITLLLGSLALVFLVMEVGLRLIGYGAAGDREGNLVHHRAAEFEHTATLNSLDLRDEEIGPKAPGEFRILALGDSFTYGLGVEEADCFVRRSEALLNEGADPSRHYRVLNGGVGKGPHFQMAWLRRNGAGLEPDFVVHTLFIGNDLYDDLRTREQEATTGLPGAANPGGARGAARTSVFLDWMWGRLVRVPVVDKMLFKAGYRYESRGLFLVEQPDLERRAWERMLAGILEGVRDRRVRGIGTMVVIVPTSDQVRYGDDRPEGQDYMLPNRILSEFLAENGVPFVDLLPLMEREADRDAFYYVRDLHWTAAGHAFVADAVVERLRGLLANAPS